MQNRAATTSISHRGGDTVGLDGVQPQELSRQESKPILYQSALFHGLDRSQSMTWGVFF